MDLPNDKRENLTENEEIMAFFKKQHGEAASFLINWLEKSAYQNKVSHQLLGLMIILHKNQVKPQEMSNFIHLPQEILFDLDNYYKKHHLIQNIKVARSKLNLNQDSIPPIMNKNNL
jgi:hypothetical protein